MISGGATDGSTVAPQQANRSTPGRDRTADLQFRKLSLYPTELREYGGPPSEFEGARQVGPAFVILPPMTAPRPPTAALHAGDPRPRAGRRVSGIAVGSRVSAVGLFVGLNLSGCAAEAVNGAGNGKDSQAPDGPIPWSGALRPTGDELSPLRGLQPRRSIIHLHSPWSHDACDGEGTDAEGAPNLSCLADLRAGLCSTAVDLAFLTDHPAHAGEQPWEDLFYDEAGDERIPGDDGQTIATRVPCGAPNDDHRVLWMPGIEDELMPVSLKVHAGADAAENDRLYNGFDAEAIAADVAAGSTVLLAHTEQRDPAVLASLIDVGLQGVELFNLHAMFDPDIRADYLGLDQMGWLADVAPFTSESGTAEPDLLFLAVLQQQDISIETWDGLNAIRPVVGTAGTDAHQNVLPILLRDGERGDSYRRMLRWFSNMVLVESGEPTPATAQAALEAGRLYVAFEVLGTPETVDFHLEGPDGAVTEMGSIATGLGTLHVGCPTLAPSAPRGEEAPEISVSVFRDGELWQEGCGDFEVTQSGVYRMRATMIPYHLRDFLGEAPDVWLHEYPWIYTNPLHVAP